MACLAPVWASGVLGGAPLIRLLLVAVPDLAAAAQAGADVAAWPSPGCQNALTADPRSKPWGSATADASWRGWVPVRVDDFEAITRWFWAEVPRGVGTDRRPAPLLLSFHGQSGHAKDQASYHSFFELGQEHSFLSVYPQGIDDSVPIVGHDDGTGWNVGTAGDDSTCVPDDTRPACYASCRSLGLCGECNWATCYDDRLFVKAVIESIAGDLCVDLSRIYVHGESNGGMFAYYLMQEMPGTFAAVVPWFGLPLLGYTFGPSYGALRNPGVARQTALLHLHGRQDGTIPLDGGLAETGLPGWIYEPLDQVHRGWAAVHGCARSPSPLHTHWDGGSTKLMCSEHQSCQSGRRVARCLYDGYHGDYPEPDGAGDQITVWFMLQFRLNASNASALVAEGGQPEPAALV